MISSVNSSSLSQIYRAQKNEYSVLQERIASGKQINKPSDDFVGYTRAAGISTKIDSYKAINSDLTETREAAKMASDTGNAIFEDMTRMKTLADNYAKETDADTKKTLNTEFVVLAKKITDTISNTKFGSNKVVSSTELASASINPDDSTLKISVIFDGTTADPAADIANVSGFDLSGTTTSATVKTELEKATSYTIKAESYLSQIDRQTTLNENLIASKESTYASLTELDEVKSLAKMTDLQIRQQASLSMIAQANSMAGNVARLYQ